MNLKNFVHLNKILDEFECSLHCSSNCPVDFLLHCLEDFKTYCLKVKEDSQKENKEN